ncbi:MULTISPECIES: sugar-binding domain-containing protein [unclassified Leeuwenhoekiella]|uniref:sugar-binding domain-containing protein n=1 Tax=unclassified Leeuwenhoekiella TaxID=2615029 RepID=UPI000C3E8CAD|nr:MULTISPECIES: sugar-binding domain-containing protein [unclassified Leeuwenhoekiella]MAW94352.1 beta-galactosidase [Leeuwenhoekiella sp.]MBA81028.1 beta-galactosidase [Leeuwenhoekiella sp.]|tara:strand:- start:22010 stop:24874 length:2865 start_codon:yes stop_codon:yes gene_type:complete
MEGLIHNILYRRLNHLFPLFVVLLVFSSCAEATNDVADLSGTWRFQIDSLDQGETQRWFAETLPEEIQLPGSIAENGKGDDISLKTKWTGNLWNDSLWYTSPKYAKYRQPGNIKVSFWLQPEKKYYGAAWYQRTIEIPKDWQDKVLEFSVERAHWESTVWIDDQKLGSQNTLGTAHKYLLPQNMEPGKHTLTVRMDNRVKDIDVGLDAHSITDNTQSNWNGLVGSLKLTARPRIYLESTRIFPEVSAKKIDVKLMVQNTKNENVEAELSLEAIGLSENNSKVNELTKKVSLKPGLNEILLDYDMGENPALWDEFAPNLYELAVTLTGDGFKEENRETFGMRDFKADKTRFTINGRPVFLRGTLECSIFPLTGYPPTDVESWSSIFEVIKSHGLNHMRFHSWCPPEAAFLAADKAGVYLQVEASGWATIGDGAPVDKWFYKEGEAILRDYGNHPSFVMMAYGNEPSGKNHKQYLTEYIAHFKSLDATKMYTSAAGWPYIESADYFNTPKPRIQQWNQNLNSIINAKPPQTVFDYQNIIDNTSMPVVSHEIGQWCVYPNFKEMDKYTGVLKPKNFEIFKETLENNHMGDLADSLLLASGKLQTLCYKADIEAALRTKGFAGFQLLDLHDFPGQGTALVGVLDAFWDEKGYVSPEEFKSFSGRTVPLARLEQRTFLNTDTLSASVEIAHFGANDLTDITPTWELRDSNGSIYAQGSLDNTDIPIGNGTILGAINIPLDTIKAAKQLNLQVAVDGFKNAWDVWVYPSKKEEINTDLRVVTKLDAGTINYLSNGGKVLLNADKGALAADKGGDIGIGFSSIFWNTSWTNGQKPHTLGILCNPEHPALADFPTDYYSDWQWWDAMSHSNAIILDEFSPDLKPIVRVVDDWFENRRLALLFEVKVGKGKLLVSGIDLHTDLANRKEADQLLYSLKNYMNSSAFNPKQKVAIEAITALYAAQ